MSDGTVGPAIRRRRAQVDFEAEVTTARSMAAANWTMVEVPACPGLRLLHGALVLIYGEPGAGKSTLAVRALDSIDGCVVALMAEEHLGPAVGERLARLGVRREDFVLVGRSSVDDFVGVVRSHRARAVLVDSISATSLVPEDARHLIQRCELGALIAVVQVTKAGLMAGSKAWAHEADVVMRIADQKWYVEKSRFQGDKIEGAVTL